MAYARAFHNSVVLPNGQVMVIGGESYAVNFSDNTSVLVPELWDPATESFTALPPMSVPRNYHSVALLLPNARVLSAGGGLCGNGCATNHPNLQILTPHYLRNADGTAATRPVITQAPTVAGYGSALQVTADSAISAFALVRMTSTTHSVNNDQRRLALKFQTNANNSYTVAMPTNPGWAIPGNYMLFAMNAQGVPSVAKILNVGGNGAPVLMSVAEQSSAAGTAISRLSLSATGATSFSATGLPPGVALNTASGVLSGVPSTEGSYNVSVFAANGAGTVSTDFQWRVTSQGTAPSPGTVRFVKLEEVTEVKENPWASMAEFNFLDGNGAVMSRNNWTVSADSQELSGENGAATNAIDGNPGTYWHTQWRGGNPTPPHSFVVNLGDSVRVTGFRYLPRPGTGGTNGTLAQFRFYVSTDEVNWGAPVAQGDF